MRGCQPLAVPFALVGYCSVCLLSPYRSWAISLSVPSPTSTGRAQSILSSPVTRCAPISATGPSFLGAIYTPIGRLSCIPWRSDCGCLSFLYGGGRGAFLLMRPLIWGGVVCILASLICSPFQRFGLFYRRPGDSFVAGFSVLSFSSAP